IIEWQEKKEKAAQEQKVAAAAAVAPPPSEPSLQLFVRSLTGRTVTVSDVYPSTTIRQLKQMVAAKLELISGPEHVRLLYQGRILENGNAVGDYNIQNEGTLHLTLNMGTAASSSRNQFRYPVTVKDNRRMDVSYSLLVSPSDTVLR